MSTNSDRMKEAIALFNEAMANCERVADETGLSFSRGESETYNPAPKLTRKEVAEVLRENGVSTAIELETLYYEAFNLAKAEAKAAGEDKPWVDAHRDTQNHPFMMLFGKYHRLVDQPKLIDQWLNGSGSWNDLVDDYTYRPIFGWVSSVGTC